MTSVAWHVHVQSGGLARRPQSFAVGVGASLAGL